MRFWDYLRYRRRMLLAAAVCCVIFAASFALYRLPLRAVLYPVGLCLLVGLGFAVWDYRRTLKRHRALTGCGDLTAELLRELPPPESLAEEDYRAQLLHLRQLCTELQSAADNRYRDAIVRACENAQVLGAARGDTVKLGVEVAEMPQGLAGTDDKDAQVQAKITLAVVTMDENARVTSAIGDMTQPQLTVSADGTVSGPEEPVYTKNEQGDKYGMREASALHKEWYEHAEGYCSTLKGKTMAEIAAQPTDGSDADLKALCTISVTDLQKAVLAALAET